MLKRKLATLCAGLLVFTAIHAKANPGHCTGAEHPYPVHFIMPVKPHVSYVSCNDAMVKRTGQSQAVNQNAGKVMFANILIDNEIDTYTYQVQMTNLSTNVTYNFYVDPFNTLHTSVPDGQYSIFFVQYGGSGNAQHHYTVCNQNTYGYSGSFDNVTIDGSCGYLEIWDWP